MTEQAKQYARMLRALVREIARIPTRQTRSEVIATLYLAGVRADGFSDTDSDRDPAA